MSKYQKSISVKNKTYEELNALKEEGLSFDGLIQRLVKNYRVTFLNVV